jgi:hypothetical protein
LVFDWPNKIVFYLAGNQKLPPFNLLRSSFDDDLTPALPIAHRFGQAIMINLKN